MRLFSFFALLLLCPSFIRAADTIKPRKLQKGDQIAIIAPASPPRDDEKYIAQCIDVLKKKGYRVKLSSTVFPQEGYLAGSDETRAKEFMQCWCDPEIAAIWCYRGGYGCMRILDLLDYEKIQKEPKILIGMSDITALHLALSKKTGLVTFLGPAARHVLGKEAKDPYSEKQLFDVISPTWTGYKRYVYSYPKTQFIEYPHPTTIRSGTATGPLTGGNLALVASLMGTPWQIETAGKILVLEDVGEPLYRIDRMLQQLKHAGLLEKPAAVLLCSWADCKADCKADSASQKDALIKLMKDYFANAPYPVLSGFPSGHITHQVTLPINALAELNADTKTLQLLECPVTD